MGAARTALMIAATIGMTALAACNKPAPTPPPAATSPLAVAPTDTSVPPLPATPASQEVTARGKDTPANAPMGTLTQEKEANSMPLAGQANSHSSPSVDATSKR